MSGNLKATLIVVGMAMLAAVGIISVKERMHRKNLSEKHITDSLRALCVEDSTYYPPFGNDLTKTLDSENNSQRSYYDSLANDPVACYFWLNHDILPITR